MSEFHYKEIDREGWETLDVIAEAKQFNAWMYQTIKPFCKGSILELGSGIGNISAFFLQQNEDLTLSDIRPKYCDVLKAKFGQPEKVIQLDLTHPDFKNVYAAHLARYDSVFALNVVEHIQDDKRAIQNCYELLKPGGKLTILVPAYQALYNRFDRELEHYRRYNADALTSLISSCRFSEVQSTYFNFIGIIGWYVSGKIQGNKTIPKGQMSLYDKLVPLFKLIDKCIFNKIGLSVIGTGSKS